MGTLLEKLDNIEDIRRRLDDLEAMMTRVLEIQNGIIEQGKNGADMINSLAEASIKHSEVLNDIIQHLNEES